MNPDPLHAFEEEPEPPVVSRGVRLWVVVAIAVLVTGILLFAAGRVG